MIGDVLLITDQHKKAADLIMEKIGDIKALNKFTIAIGGESGSGKSELSHLVAKNFKQNGILVKIIHTDNFYTIPPSERSEWRKKNGFLKVGLEEIDWLSLDLTIQKFKEGSEWIMPIIDLLSDQVDRLMTNFSNIKILILDGLYSLYMDVDLKFMLDLTYKETKVAQIARGKENLDDERLKVLEKEHEAVQSLRPRADYIITKDFDIIKNLDKKNN